MNRKIHFQLIPVYGLAVGIVYYNPNLEQVIEVDDKDYYEQISIMFLFFGINITLWKE